MIFNKVCKSCGLKFESTSRNKQKCNKCLNLDEQGHWISKKRLSKYTMNNFKNDLEGLSYCLGFIYSDGYVHKNRDLIYLYSTDLDIIEKLKTRMDYNGPIQYREKPHLRCYELKLYANNAKFFKDLGCINNKYELKLPRNIDFYAFLRGLLDGDGTICIQSGRLTGIILLGQYKLLTEIKNIIGGILTEEHGYWQLRFRKEEASILLEKMYKNATIYMDRKYKRYVSIVQW